jgi:molybdate transport system substrate-binding protein
MTRVLIFLTGLLGALCLAGAPAIAADKPPVVLAAASLQESLNAAADAWAAKGHARPILSFAGSSDLARQIEAGAPADLFLSADEDWMDTVQKHGDIVPGTRVTFLGNRLVLAAPAGRSGKVATRPNAALGRTLAAGPVAMADVGSVPAGKYGKAALEHMGIWQVVEPHVVQADNVRAALALVERGAAPFAIVYATDAKASTKVRTVGVFPESSHKPIRYPVARLKAGTSDDAEGFRRFLISRAGKAIFARFGFSPQ